MEKIEIREIVNYINSIYVHKQIKLTTDIIDVWHEMIGEYAKEQVISVIKNIARTKNYAPNLATLAEELRNTFVIRHTSIGSNFVVFVDFEDCRFPFNFEKKEDAKTLVDYLKTNPTKDNIEFYFDEFTKSRNSFICSLHIDQRIREEIDRQAKSDYYKRNAKKK